MKKLPPPEIEHLAAYQRQHFSAFVRGEPGAPGAWDILEPRRPLIWGGTKYGRGHLDAYVEHIEAWVEGRIQKLLVNVPPGHAKSMFFSVLTPAWCWARNPGDRMLCAAYAGKLTRRDSSKTRALVTSPWYQARFVRGLWQMKDDQDRVDDFGNTQGGLRFCTSPDSSGTGHRGDKLFIDDPQSAEEARSKAGRANVIVWYADTLSTRLDETGDPKELVVQQRFHDDDLSGYLLREGGWEHLCLSEEHKPGKWKGTSIGWSDWRTKPGELLFPEVIDETKLKAIKKRVKNYTGQYGQDPVDDGLAMFHRRNFRFYHLPGTQPGQHNRPRGCWEGPSIELPKMLVGLLSLDAAFRDGDENDYVVGEIWGHAGDPRRFLLDLVRDKMDFDTTCDVVGGLIKRWKKAKGFDPWTFLTIIEGKANGDAVINHMSKKFSGIITVDPLGGKEARAASVQPEQKSGHLYLLDGAPYLAEFIEELERFPKGVNDDQVDAMSQALNYLSEDTEGIAAAEALCTL